MSAPVEIPVGTMSAPVEIEQCLEDVAESQGSAMLSFGFASSESDDESGLPELFSASRIAIEATINAYVLHERNHALFYDIFGQLIH